MCFCCAIPSLIQKIKAVFPAADYPVEIYIADGTVEMHEPHLRN